ncbi:MAG: cupin domain-containing protein [Akkermansiaceae bacterium]|nr:cupin domain-containing protein [Verrucomicrobiales bacterium]
MNKINQEQVEWVETKSPKGKFQVSRRHISLALGGKKDTGAFGGGQPFDLELTRIPPGAVNWPYHAHSVQWEMFVVLSGRGQTRTPEGEFEIGPGDCFIHPPGEPHQIFNPGTEDLVFYVIADNLPDDIVEYPDSKKWVMKRCLNGKFTRNVFEMTEVDYYQDEE